MFQVEYNKDIQTVFLRGSFDASKAEEVKEVLTRVDKSVSVDMSGLDFICSAGVGLMVMTYRNLKEKGEDFCLVNLKTARVNKLSGFFVLNS